MLITVGITGSDVLAHLNPPSDECRGKKECMEPFVPLALRQKAQDKVAVKIKSESSKVG